MWDLPRAGIETLCTARRILNHWTTRDDFAGGSDSKPSVYNAGDPGSIPGLGRSLGEGNGNPLQYYCLENPMDRGAWWAIVSEVTVIYD